MLSPESLKVLNAFLGKLIFAASFLPQSKSEVSHDPCRRLSSRRLFLAGVNMHGYPPGRPLGAVLAGYYGWRLDAFGFSMAV